MGIEGVPFFLCKSTYYGIAKPSSAAIRAAIDSVLGNNVFLDSDSDDLTGPTYRQPGDSPHLNDLGASVDSTHLFNALDAVL